MTSSVNAASASAVSLDERVMGFAFPKEERAALVASDQLTFQLPRESDLRFNWVHADLEALDPAEPRELVVDAWRMVVPQKTARAYDLAHPSGPAHVEPRSTGPTPDAGRRGPVRTNALLQR